MLVVVCSLFAAAPARAQVAAGAITGVVTDHAGATRSAACVGQLAVKLLV